MRSRLLILGLPVLFTATLAAADEAKSLYVPNPPPPEQPEPAPAQLAVTPEAPATGDTAPREAPPDTARTRQLPSEPTSARTYRMAAWAGVGVTLAFITSGVVLGVLAQRDSDDLQRLLGERTGGKPPLFDADHRDRYNMLTGDGTAYNRATIACFIVAGIGAVTSGLLFWDATRRAKEGKSLALRSRLQPSAAIASGQAQLLLGGRF